MVHGWIFFVVSTIFISAIDCSPLFQEIFFNQPIDHFNFKSQGSKEFAQRYLLAGQYWTHGGPIFFYTGNEGDIVQIQKGAGFLMEQAPRFNALVVYAEHRYYGKSLPFGNRSLIGENVGFLTVNQALADYVYLAKFLVSTWCDQRCPIIAFGASYGGILAAYMRFKYPNIVEGALSSSAPLYGNAGLTNRSEFFKTVTEQFEKSSRECVMRIKQGFSEIESWARQGKYDEITRHTQACTNLTSANLQKLYGWIRTGYTILAMWNFPYSTEVVRKMPAFPVDVACNLVLHTANAASGIVQAASLFYNSTTNFSVPCYDFESQYYECSDPTGCGPGEHGQAWDYQCCTEMILPGGSNNVTDMFPPMPFTLEMRKKFCQKKWGVTPRNDWAEIQFWGKNISSVTNIIFSNGELDPWGPGGVHQSPNVDALAIEVAGGAHHLDLRYSNPKDPYSVLQVRNVEATIIAKWIVNYRNRI